MLRPVLDGGRPDQESKMRFEQDTCPDCGGDPLYTEERAPFKYYLTRVKGDKFKVDDNEAVYDSSESVVPGVSLLVCGSCHTHWRSRNEAGEGMKFVYRVTARHCSGKSVSHPCRPGVYDDPTDNFDEMIGATSHDEAINQGYAILREMVASYEPCACRRGLNPGSEAWWESVSLSARL